MKTRRRGKAARMGTSKPSVVETNVSQSGSKASLAEVGLMAPSHEGLPEELAGLGVVGLLFEVVHFHAQGGDRDRGLVIPWQVKLALLLEARAVIRRQSVVVEWPTARDAQTQEAGAQNRRD